MTNERLSGQSRADFASFVYRLSPWTFKACVHSCLTCILCTKRMFERKSVELVETLLGRHPDWKIMFVFACVYVCVYACARVCVRICVCVRACTCVRAFFDSLMKIGVTFLCCSNGIRKVCLVCSFFCFSTGDRFSRCRVLPMYPRSDGKICSVRVEGNYKNTKLFAQQRSYYGHGVFVSRKVQSVRKEISKS